jgi:hypothetical protein
MRLVTHSTQITRVRLFAEHPGTPIPSFPRIILHDISIVLHLAILFFVARATYNLQSLKCSGRTLLSLHYT